MTTRPSIAHLPTQQTARDRSGDTGRDVGVEDAHRDVARHHRGCLGTDRRRERDQVRGAQLGHPSALHRERPVAVDVERAVAGEVLHDRQHPGRLDALDRRDHVPCDQTRSPTGSPRAHDRVAVTDADVGDRRQHHVETKSSHLGCADPRGPAGQRRVVGRARGHERRERRDAQVDSADHSTLLVDGDERGVPPSSHDAGDRAVHPTDLRQRGDVRLECHHATEVQPADHGRGGPRSAPGRHDHLPRLLPQGHPRDRRLSPGRLGSSAAVGCCWPVVRRGVVCAVGGPRGASGEHHDEQRGHHRTTSRRGQQHQTSLSARPNRGVLKRLTAASRRYLGRALRSSLGENLPSTCPVKTGQRAGSTMVMPATVARSKWGSSAAASSSPTVRSIKRCGWRMPCSMSVSMAG